MNISLRTKNRIREHTDHSWGMIQTNLVKINNDLEPCGLFDCTCGWLGWLPLEEVAEARRLGLM